MNNIKSNFRRGSVELLILHLLDQQDYYGYELSLLIKKKSDGYLDIPVGSLYPALYKLIDLGKRLIHVYYHLEDTGRDRLALLLEDYYATATAIQKVLNYYKEESSKNE